MQMEDWTAAGTLSRLGDGAWSVAFAEPSTLAGVVLDFSGGEVTASYKGLGFSVPQSAMPAKSVLSQMILVVDELAQQEEITGKEKDGGVAVEGESEGNPYTLTLTESGELAFRWKTSMPNSHSRSFKPGQMWQRRSQRWNKKRRKKSPYRDKPYGEFLIFSLQFMKYFYVR